MIALVEEEEFRQSLKKLEKYKKEQKTVNSYMQTSNKNNDTVTFEENEFTNIPTSASTAIAGISNKKITDIKDEIILNIIDDTWIHIKGSDDKVIISKLMKKNEKFILNSNPYYIITTGNAGNIEILIKNERIGKLGKKGAVLNSFKLTSNFISN